MVLALSWKDLTGLGYIAFLSIVSIVVMIIALVLVRVVDYHSLPPFVSIPPGFFSSFLSPFSVACEVCFCLEGRGAVSGREATQHSAYTFKFTSKRYE